MQGELLIRDGDQSPRFKADQQPRPPPPPTRAVALGVLTEGPAPWLQLHFEDFSLADCFFSFSFYLCPSQIPLLL